MTPETRAARDRIAAFAEARDDHLLPHEPDRDVPAVIWQGGVAVKLMRADLRAVLGALDDEPVPVLTDSMTYLSDHEDELTTALREEIHRLAGERNDAIRERDLWETRTRKLLGERSGRLTLEALDAAAG